LLVAGAVSVGWAWITDALKQRAAVKEWKRRRRESGMAVVGGAAAPSLAYPPPMKSPRLVKNP
jgi:hypothetical protein